MNRLTVIVMLVMAGWSAPAAQPFMEGWAGGANGWVGAVGFGSWAFTGGTARVRFIDQGSLGFPDEGVLSNSPPASAGSFTGNFESAGIEAVGFRFMAPSFLPSSVTLEWAGSTSVFQRGFPVTQTGVWYSFATTLDAADTGAWTAVKGHLSDWSAALQSVKYVAIRVVRSGTTQRDYLIDDVFLANRPTAGGAGGAGGAAFVWDDLLAQARYQVQGSTNLAAGAWYPVESLTSTGSTHATVITNRTEALEAFRIVFD